MFRKIIDNGDLAIMYQPWYCTLTGKWKPYRNLSEEVRFLGSQMEEALSKYKELQRWYAIASKNVGDDLETLQILKMENSEAYFEVAEDSSILDMRDGTKYNFGGHKKQDASANKDKQQQQQKKQQEKSKERSLLELLSTAKVTTAH